VGILALTSGMLYAQEYSFRYFGVTEGLTNLGVAEIYQDRVGFIWVSTENGIFRYDGDRFEAFGPEQGIPSNPSAALGDAPDGTLLAGGLFGLYRLHGNRFEKLSFDFKTVSWAQGIQADGKGHTFLGTDSGLKELYVEPGKDGFAMRGFPQPPGTTGSGAWGVLVDGDTLWYGCGNELCRKDSNGTAVYGRESGLPEHACMTIRKDRDGNLWVRARNVGVFELPAGESKFRRPDTPFTPEAMGGVSGIDADGRILLPTSEGLLIREENGWQKIDRTVGLRGTVYSVLEDRQHTLWIGLEGRGLAQWLGYREWENYTTASGLGNDLVYEMLPRADGSMLVGTEGGLFRGERRQLSMVWKQVAGVGNSPVHSVQLAPDGDIWLGTETHGAGRLHLPAGSVEWFGDEQGLAARQAYTLRFDREKRLWAATEAGLFVANAPYRRFSRITELPATRIWAVAEGRDGTIWAGGTGGLYSYEAGRWKNFTKTDGLSNQEVLSLGADANGKMWVGYRFGGGIDRVQSSPGGLVVENGVQRRGTDGIVYFLDFDAAGRLWAGTERGVDAWDGSRWSHYDIRNGLAGDDCNLNAFASEADGTVWIGTSAGLSHFKPRSSGSPDAPIKVVFTHLVMGTTDVSGLQNPSFGIPSNSLIARYAAPNASREDATVFRYRLKGANAAWTETPQQELQFAQLAPGAYRLEVEAQDENSAWGRHGAEFPFVILTPWYWSWWFIGVCMLVPLSGAGAVLRFRMMSAQRRVRELAQLVEEKTVDLRRANAELQRLSSTDPLTGLANRRVFDHTLEMECARLQRSGTAVSLLMIDVDHFKDMNDSQGHQRGDECLMRVATELTRLVKRQIDLVARYGGEEFAVILPATSAADAERLGESTRLAIAGLKLPHLASPVAPFLTVSVGVATATVEGWKTPEELVAAADEALYSAKRSGRNRAVVSVRAPGSGGEEIHL
jgi:diguanylate cyclase (GGDEF)-like protein